MCQLQIGTVSTIFSKAVCYIFHLWSWFCCCGRTTFMAAWLREENILIYIYIYIDRYFLFTKNSVLSAMLLIMCPDSLLIWRCCTIALSVPTCWRMSSLPRGWVLENTCVKAKSKLFRLFLFCFSFLFSSPHPASCISLLHFHNFVSCH